MTQYLSTIGEDVAQLVSAEPDLDKALDMVLSATRFYAKRDRREAVSDLGHNLAHMERRVTVLIGFLSAQLGFLSAQLLFGLTLEPETVDVVARAVRALEPERADAILRGLT